MASGSSFASGQQEKQIDYEFNTGYGRERRAQATGEVGGSSTLGREFRRGVEARDEIRDAARGMLTSRTAPQVTGPSYDDAALARALQAQAAGGYAGIISGQGPSVAQAQLQQTQDAAARQAMALAASSRGNPMLAQRAAVDAQSQIALQGGQQMAQLRAHEQAQALAGLSGAAQGMRAQDLMTTDQQQALGLANAGLTMQGRQLDDARQVQGMQGLQGAQTLEQQIQMQLLGMQQGYWGQSQQLQQQARESIQAAKLSREQMALQRSLANQQMQMQLVGAGLQAGGTAVAASDERVKTAIEDGEGATRDLLSALKANVWRYKRELLESGEGSEGKHLGVMAQDLERSEIGREMVREGTDGVKRVDLTKMLMASLAANAHLHRRVERLEREKAA